MTKDEPSQGGRHQLDSDQRRTLLGEETLHGPSSVMELLRPEDRERLQNIRNSSNLPPTKTTTSQTSHEALRPAGMSAGPSALMSSSVQQQQQQEALTMWKGVQTSSQTFRPFEKNSSKQARYELYLNRLKQGDKDALEQSLDPGMTEWERSREREEFVRASILYRPSSSSLSSRFTRAKHQEDEDAVEVNRDQEGDVDDKQAAVKMKMFGKLTRETFEWHPDKLLCKRFNVPDPYPGSGVVGMPKVKRDKFSVFNFLTMTENRATPAPPKPVESGKKSRWDVSGQAEGEEEKKKDPLSELLSTARNQTSETKLDLTSTPALPASVSTSVQHGDSKHESEEQPNQEKKREGDEEADEEEEEESRPPMDLFKAIFASSSDEKSSSSEGESDEEDQKEVQEQADALTPNLFKIMSTSSVTSSTNTTSTSTATMSSQQKAVTSQTSHEDDMFGPKLPPPSSALSESTPSHGHTTSTLGKLWRVYHRV